MSRKVEEFLKRMRENALEPEEALEIIMRLARPSEPYCLELIYDETAKTVTLQGDHLGLDIVRRIVNWLADPDTEPGERMIFGEPNYLTKSNVRLIIQRVEHSESNDVASL